MPLNQCCVAYIHQLQGGLLHNSSIGQNALPDFLVVLQDEDPPGHCACPLLFWAFMDGTELNKNGLYQATTIWPLGKWCCGGECVPLHTFHPWSELLPLFGGPEPPCVQPALVSGSKHHPLLIKIKQVLPKSNYIAHLRRENR